MAGLTQKQIDELVAKYNAGRTGRRNPLTPTKAKLTEQIRAIEALAADPDLLKRFLTKAEAARAAAPNPLASGTTGTSATTATTTGGDQK